MSFNLSEESVREIVRGVLSQIRADGSVEPPADCPCRLKNNAQPKGGFGATAVYPSNSASASNAGIFSDADEAVAAAREAFLKFSTLGLKGRDEVIKIVKDTTIANAEAWGRFEYEETKIGRLDHKVEKLQIIAGVPGTEWLKPDAYSGDDGIMLEEFTPYGVIGAITPVTHSIPTIAGNCVSMAAAGNAVVFNPHPNGAKSAVLAISAFNKAIEKKLGIKNLFCCIEKPTLDTFAALAKNPLVAIMCITGGPGVVAAAMKSGKKCICAGPGNPPVIVDGTVDPNKAAKDIIAGSAYDNNLLCVSEKEVFVTADIYDRFIAAMKANGGFEISGEPLRRLTDAAFELKDGHYRLKRALVGKDPSVLAEAAGVSIPQGTQLLFAQTDANHPFVVEEQMMPMLPIVKAADFDEALAFAQKAEHGYRHSALIHSLNVDHMTRMARVMDTTVFIKNGPCMCGLGLGGEGYLSYSIATTTGEGISNPKTFTRRRRCVMVGNLSLL